MLPGNDYEQYVAAVYLGNMYPFVDGQQTGNNFVGGNKQHVEGNM